MNRRVTVALTIAVAITLSACAPAEPGPTPTATRTAEGTPTPTATVDAIPTQAPTPAPTDQASAIAAANTAYQGYRDASLKLLGDPSLGARYMSGYVLQGTPAAQQVDDTVRANIESGLRATGGPFKWQLNEALSYAAPATNETTGEVSEFGGVYLFGCSDNTAVTFTNPDIPKGLAPFTAALVYVSAQQAWMVQDDDQFRPGDAGAPQC